MIVVVGANGFLGRHLCGLLQRRGEAAVAVSRCPDRLFFQRFAPSVRPMTAEAFASAEGDEVLSQADAVIYLVWRSVPATFASEPWRELSENVQPAFRFFSRVAGLTPRTKIVLLSSGGTIYGGDEVTPRNEASLTRPISGYGFGKLMAEDSLRFVARTKGASFSILRVSNALGRWQRNEAQGIIGIALRAARDGQPVTLYGGGHQVRDFVDADDVARAILAASKDAVHPNSTWNIGSGVGVRICEAIEVASRVIQRPISIETRPDRGIDVPHVVLDCRKAETELGWKAEIPLERSILSAWNSSPDAR